MAERIIYSCDWCKVDAPRSGSVGEDWQRIGVSAGKPEWICGTCWKARKAAIETARSARSGSEGTR